MSEGEEKSGAETKRAQEHITLSLKAIEGLISGFAQDLAGAFGEHFDRVSNDLKQVGRQAWPPMHPKTNEEKDAKQQDEYARDWNTTHPSNAELRRTLEAHVKVVDIEVIPKAKKV